MIRIFKHPEPPEILGIKGAHETELLKQLFVETGERNFKFKREIYAHKKVKDAIILSQNEKCCFCEETFTHVGHGDVEHFRPKGGTQQNEKDQLVTPGYYWLVYDWNNLFLSCEICNQSYKKNYFPLVLPENRAKTHLDDISLEDPLIIHPALENPEDHLTFDEEIIKPVNSSQKGNETIKRTGLDRYKLEKDRRKYFKLVKRLAESLAYDLPEHNERKAELQDLGQPDSRYSSMVKANFRHLWE